VEKTILKLKGLKKNEEIIKVGSEIEIEYKETGKKLKLIIVGATYSKPNKMEISIDSPLAKAVLGAREGEVREFRVGAKKQRVQIIQIKQKKE